MGAGHKPLPPRRSKAVFLVPVLLCLAILWQTRQLYGSCAAPAGIASVEALQSYLLDTARALRRRNTTAADTLQQLAANIAQSAPQAAALQQELNETRSFLHSSKDKIIEHMIEITSLKKKTGSQEHEIQQKQREVEHAQNAVKFAQEEVEKLQQQLKEKGEQLEKQSSQQQEVEQARNAAKSAKQEVEQAKKAANAAKQEVEKLLQQLKEKEEQLKKQSTQPAQKQQVVTAMPDEDAVFGRMRILELAGLQCNAVKDQEFWADPLVWGYDHRAADASECCASCHAYNAAVERGGTDKGRNSSRCNTWAFCADKEICKDRIGECWVKHQKVALPAPPALPPDSHAHKGWISGVVYQDDVLLQADRNSSLVMHTSLGDITVQLLPELAPATVREIQRAAKVQVHSMRGCSNCRIYRPEPNFVVQGILEFPGGYVAVPRHPSPPQPMVMPRGMVCWATGTGGPHWFVNLVDNKLSDEHLCWGKVHDMALFDKIVTLPRKDKKPGAMEALVEPIRYNISVKVV